MWTSLATIYTVKICSLPFRLNELLIMSFPLYQYLSTVSFFSFHFLVWHKLASPTLQPTIYEMIECPIYNGVDMGVLSQSHSEKAEQNKRRNLRGKEPLYTHTH